MEPLISVGLDDQEAELVIRALIAASKARVKANDRHQAEQYIILVEKHCLARDKQQSANYQRLAKKYNLEIEEKPAGRPTFQG